MNEETSAIATFFLIAYFYSGLYQSFYLQMFDGVLGIGCCHIHPVLYLAVLLLLCQPGFGDYGIENDLALHCEEGGEDGRTVLLSKAVHVSRHQALQEGMRVWPAY